MIVLNLKDGANSYTLKSKENINMENVKQFVHETTGKSNIILLKNGIKMDDNVVIHESMVVEVKKVGCGIDNCKIKIKHDTCQWCSITFCGKHRLPEEHTCKNISECRKNAADKNKSDLNKYKIGTKKLM